MIELSFREGRKGQRLRLPSPPRHSRYARHHRRHPKGDDAKAAKQGVMWIASATAEAYDDVRDAQEVPCRSTTGRR
jgi:hypothetical protein